MIRNQQTINIMNILNIKAYFKYPLKEEKEMARNMLFVFGNTVSFCMSLIYIDNTVFQLLYCLITDVFQFLLILTQ